MLSGSFISLFSISQLCTSSDGSISTWKCNSMQVHCVISVIDALNIWHGRGSAMQFLLWLNLRETATGTFHTALEFASSELNAKMMYVHLYDDIIVSVLR